MIKNPPANAGDAVQFLVRKIPWRRKWQPTPIFLPGKSHGQRSLAGYSSWGHNSQTQLSASVGEDALGLVLGSQFPSLLTECPSEKDHHLYWPVSLLVRVV